MISTSMDKQASLSNPFQSEADFEQLYSDNYAVLYLHALKMLGDREAAKDIVQEVFTSTWQKRADIRIQSSAKAYLFQAVKNKILNIYAHETVARRFRAPLPSVPLQWMEDDALREQRLMEQIESEISKLPEQMATVFRMSRLQNKTQAEIAEELNVSITTVKTHIGRALKKLRSKFLHFLYLFF